MNSPSFVSRVQKYWKEYLITGMFGGISTPIGQLFRNSVYRFILSKMGKSVCILPNVRLIGTSHIAIGDRVKLQPSAYLHTHGNPIHLGNHVVLDQGVNIRAGGGEMGVYTDGISIGENTYISAYAFIAGPGSVRIGRDCLIASHCSIYASNHIFADRNTPIHAQGLTMKGVTIEDDCWLGSGVRVLDGVTIGRGSVIGAGAVVTKSIPPFSIAVGVPAKVIGTRGSDDRSAALEKALALQN
ncbi:acyltransferase [Microcoleus sp. FACHB-1515]|uniref:DapH/DapD/GlmU-related protein n=1 Tax=Cyanophyceae TaxID=3028117 RepID=UPI00168841BD|nr:acyltransferase [Microcoleus sp. FACHB-1515]MBD2093297.1 acyltransferase [Microcoleus sp. FACHB-1515]